MPQTKNISRTIDRSRHVVLVVDDNPSTRYSTQRILRVGGFQTKEAATGQEGLDLSTTDVSAVVLDVDLPDMSGFEVCARTRLRPETARLPIIHLSATYVDDVHKVAGLDAGADAYLVHPVEPSVLIATVQALVRARMAEDSLRRSDARFRAVYEHAESGIALVDTDGAFVDVNPAFTRLLGRSREELLALTLHDLATPESEKFLSSKTSADGHASWKAVLRLGKPDGGVVALDWTMSPHVEPGLRIGISSDASDRVELDRRREEVLEREQAARATAERHSRTKDDFVAVLSHELRTPLNAISGWVEVLLEQETRPPVKKGLDAIARNTKAQARIIADILDVSRINLGKLRLEREHAVPADLVNSAITSLQAQLDAKNLVLEKRFRDVEGPAWLDPTRFTQIFWNLLTNAIKFSRKGDRIEVTLERVGEQLELTVRDHGQGIRPEFLPHLFDRFSQSDAPGNRTHGGLGLGLAIVAHLAEMHGGSASAASEGAGLGTTMKVVLPVRRPTEESPPLHDARAPTRASNPALGELDVLAVEDDPDAAELVAMVLSERGAKVRTAVDFDGALAAARERWPDLVVSDIGLPGRDGNELIRELRKLAVLEGRKFVAIALTAFSRPEDEVRSREAGFDGFLGKPFRPHALIDEIARLTQRA
jgi:PAS domain S-box-containing protein